jgi:hypothetical protein
MEVGRRRPGDVDRRLRRSLCRRAHQHRPIGGLIGNSLDTEHDIRLARRADQSVSHML